MKYESRDRRNVKLDRGFTLIELMLVMVIIGVLAGSVVVVYRGQAQDAKIQRALSDIRSYQSTIEVFALKNNDRFPAQLLELTQGETPYIESLNRDPWGNAYVYRNPGTHHKNSYDLFSMGPDGREGTEDDVAPWLAEE